MSTKKNDNVQDLDIVYDNSHDDTRIGYYGTAQDPFRGAIIEEGWRYAIVTEHPAAKGLASAELEARQLGYEIAPAPRKVRERWDAAKQWVMRIPMAQYEERKKAERDRAAENRNYNAGNTEVIQNERKKISLAELTNG